MALILHNRRLPGLLLLLCLGTSLLGACPARASQPPLLATATSTVDRVSGQIAAAPAAATAQAVRTVPAAAVPQAVGAAVQDTAQRAGAATGAVEQSVEPVVSGASGVVHELPAPARALAPVEHTLEGAVGTVRNAAGLAPGTAGAARRTVTTQVATPPGGRVPTPAARPAPTARDTAEGSAPAAAPAAARSALTPAKPPASPRMSPAAAHARGSLAGAAASAPSRSEVTGAALPAAASQPPLAPESPPGHAPLRLPAPGGTLGFSLTAAPGGGVAFVLILVLLLTASLPTLTRRLRPAAALRQDVRHVLILDRPG